MYIRLQTPIIHDIRRSPKYWRYLFELIKSLDISLSRFSTKVLACIADIIRVASLIQASSQLAGAIHYDVAIATTGAEIESVQSAIGVQICVCGASITFPGCQYLGIVVGSYKDVYG